MKIVTVALTAVLTAGAVFAAPEEIPINTTEVNGRYVDDFSNLSFVNDPAVLGKWVSVDFVKTPSQFVPGVRRFRGDLYLGGFNFYKDGAMGIMPNAPESAPWFGWTRGVVMHLGGDHTASRYTIKEIDGAMYMFFEWKSGDYIIRHQKPQYYVLKKVAGSHGRGEAAEPVRTGAN